MAVSGYYPDTNLLIDDLPNYGFGSLTNWDDKTKESLRTAVLLSIETGLAFKIKEQTLYTGLYFDYGLGNMLPKGTSENIVSYSTQDVELIQANSVLTNQEIVDRANYISAGIQLKWGFTLKKRNKIPAAETVVEETSLVEEQRPVVAELPKKERTLPVVVDSQKLSEQERSVIESPITFKGINKAEPSLEVRERLDAIVEIMDKKPHVKLKKLGIPVI